MPAARSRAMPWPATSGFGSTRGDHHAGDAGVDQRIAAGRRAAVVGAGFQADPGGGAAQVVRRLRAHRASAIGLGMRPAGLLGEAAGRATRPSADAMTQPTRGLGSLRPMAPWARARASFRRVRSVSLIGMAPV